MNRKTIAIITTVVALGAFVIGALLYQSQNNHAGSQQPKTVVDALVRSHSPIMGPADASVTIVEFFDPACETCRAFYPIVKRIMAEFPGKVRLVIRYVNFHPQSEDAIRILEAARLQGKFKPVLETLLKHQPEWAPHGRIGIDPWTILSGTGLDIEKAKQDATAADILSVINQDMADVSFVKIQATPSFFVNGKRLEEFGTVQLFEMVKTEVDTLK